MLKTCRNCNAEFEITEEDLRFYDKVSPVFNREKYLIPPPTLCPDCRSQKRLSFLNLRNLYKITNKNNETIISAFSEDKDLNIMDITKWYSDEKECPSFEIDWNLDFFEQFKKLQKISPRWARITANCENCDWCINTVDSKDCYLIRSSMYSKNCFFSERLINCHDVSDSTVVDSSEKSYELIDCENCFEVCFGQKLKNCQNSLLLHDCENVSSSLFCVNLRYKKYHIFNSPVSKEEFLEIKNNFLTNEEYRKEIFKKFEEFKLRFPKKANIIINSENCYGDEIYNSKKTYNSFSVKKCEDCNFIDYGSETKDSYDFSQPDLAELCYECSSCYKLYHCLFCFNVVDMENCIFCETCSNCKNCFLCVGINKKEYCILNKQYTKEEYEALVPKIIEYMIHSTNSGFQKWGEFFPIKNSLFSYNETVASDYFSIAKEEAVNRGWKWTDEDFIKEDNNKSQIEEDISLVKENITQIILRCEDTGKPYKIIPQELEFYKKIGIPIPKKCPEQRHKDRLKLRNPRKLWERKCMKCSKDIITTYAPDRPEIVYCEECYLKEVY